MAAIDDLTDARTNIAARIKEITAAPKPTYKVEDQEFEWGEYLEILIASYDKINDLVNDGSPPWELRMNVLI